MRLLALVAALGLAAVAACGAHVHAPPPPPDFAIAADFTAEERAEVQAAADTWNPILRTPITLDGGPWRMVHGDPGDHAWIGSTARSLALVVIRPLPPGVSIRAIAAHELGHSVGLRHLCTTPETKGPAASDQPCPAGPSLGIMSPIGGAIEVSAADLAECRAVGACP